MSCLTVEGKCNIVQESGPVDLQDPHRLPAPSVALGWSSVTVFFPPGEASTSEENGASEADGVFKELCLALRLADGEVSSPRPYSILHGIMILVEMK